MSQRPQKKKKVFFVTRSIYRVDNVRKTQAVKQANTEKAIVCVQSVLKGKKRIIIIITHEGLRKKKTQHDQGREHAEASERTQTHTQYVRQNKIKSGKKTPEHIQ